MSITVMKQTTDALDEILESFEKDGKFCKSSVIRNELFDKLKTTLEQSKQAIAEEEKNHIEDNLTMVHEPVAVARVDDLERGGRVRALAMGLSLDAPLYTSPPQRQPLTDDEAMDAYCETPPFGTYKEAFIAGIRFIEAVHGIKGEA